jgi:C1A family cysteine protease
MKKYISLLLLLLISFLSYSQGGFTSNDAKPSNPSEIQKTRLTLSPQMRSRGKNAMRSITGVVPTDQQITSAIVAGQATFPTSLRVAIPPLVTQGSDGSCVDFADVRNCMSAWKYYGSGETSYSNSTNIFSVEYVYDQIKVGSGCASGSTMIACFNFMVNNGDVLESEVPTIPDGTCTITPTSLNIQHAAQNKITGYSYVVAQDINAIKSILNQGKPLGFTFNMDYNQHYGRDYNPAVDCNSQNFTLATNNNYVWSALSPCQYGPHANAIIGYDDSKNALLTAENYGTSWGDSGTRWIDYTFFGTIAYECFYITDGSAPPPTPINQPPIASVCCNQSVSTGTSVNLNGTASYDPDGRIVSYAWQQLSGPNSATITNSTQPIASFGNLIAGTYNFQLVVTDDSAATAHASAIVTVSSSESYSITSAVKRNVKGTTSDAVSWNIVLNTFPQFAVLEVSYTSNSSGFATINNSLVPYSPTGTYINQISKSNKNKPRYYRLRIIKTDGSTAYSTAVQAI